LQRISLLYIVLFTLIGLLVLRLLQLQVFEHDKYKRLAHNNTTRRSLARAPRGIIYDRFGKILVTSKQSLSVVLYPAILKKETDLESFSRKLSKYIDLEQEDLLATLKKIDPSTPLPITLDNDVDIKTAIKIHENESLLPGVLVQEEATRYYPYGGVAAHVLGFVGQINNNELKKGQDRGLGLGDLVGKDGIEKSFDETLQGVKGESRVAVDRYGRVLVNENFDKPNIQKPIKGQDLRLTIDLDLQKAAYEGLGENMGAAVAINPKTGEVLVLASSPSFDPNLFTKPVKSSVYSELSEKRAFLNRALNAYTPGSIWKPLTTLAALEHGVLTTSDYYRVSGAYYMGGFKFGDWTSASSVMNIYEALAWSRNTFFYQVAKNMKPEWISDLASSFGIGQITGLELSGESEGVLPSPEWKKKTYKQDWYPGNTLHFAIGQSFLMVTPLQVAKLYAGIANNGFLPEIHLVKDDREYKLKAVPGVSLENIKIVKTGLEQCIDSGTGGASKFTDVVVAGKTGSAEVYGYAHTTHGWFASYAPAHDPEIVIVVFMEGGGHGGSVAAPVARKIYEAYFAKMKANEAKSITVDS